MGKFAGPSTPTPPPPPPEPPRPATLADENVQAAAEDERRRNRAARGFASTRLTDALTNLNSDSANIQRKQLLGQ